MTSTVNLYACGGAATNIAKKFLNRVTKPGIAKINPVFIDTSKSNIRTEELENFYHINEDGERKIDGGGKKRASVSSPISDRINDILVKFKPTDFNIVLHSTGGGSGSVLGPNLINSMLNNDVTTIVILIGSRDTRIEAYNTVKTLQSYESISNKNATPTVAAYVENKDGRANADVAVMDIIIALATIFSGDNKELDTQDIINWLNYKEVTSFAPKLAYLELVSGETVFKKGEVPISVCTLAKEGETTKFNHLVEYQAVGFMSDELIKEMNISLPTHAVIMDGVFNTIISGLNKTIDEFDNVKKTVVTKSILSGTETSDQNGLVF